MTGLLAQQQGLRVKIRPPPSGSGSGSGNRDIIPPPTENREELIQSGISRADRSLYPSSATSGSSSRPTCSGAAPVLPSSYTMTSYRAPAVARQRPRMWMGGGSAGGGIKASSSASSSGSKRVRGGGAASAAARRSNYYDSDGEDDSSSGEDDDDGGDSEDEDDEEDAIFFSPPPRKMCRRGAGGLAARNTLGASYGPYYSHIHDPLAHLRRTVVRFARPLVTSVEFRPRTPKVLKSKLFYRRSDQDRFREELRRENRLRRLGEWESEDDEDDCDGGSEHGSSTSNSDCSVTSSPGLAALTTQDDLSCGTNEAPRENGEKCEDKGEKCNEVHEVTESSSSNDDSDGDDEDEDEGEKR